MSRCSSRDEPVLSYPLPTALLERSRSHDPGDERNPTCRTFPHFHASTVPLAATPGILATMRRDAPERPERDSLTALGRVAGELVHDLANEVQVRQGWAVIARGEAAAGRPPWNEIQRVVGISARLGRMVRDVLETVSGESLTPELDFAPHPLTEATLNERVREVGSREILFRSSLPEGTRLTGRASFWSRIVTNLVSNAARFAEQTVIVA